MKKIHIKNNRACKRRRKINKLSSPHIFDKELSGKPTMFFYEPEKYWYNLCALLKFVKKLMHVDVFKQISIRGTYGSSLTDLTNY